jgi:hypothetical protein
MINRFQFEISLYMDRAARLPRSFIGWSNLPSIMEVALVKAAAFGRTIATHGSQAEQRLISKGKANCRLVFASSGATSSFRVGNCLVQMIHTSARKMQLGDTSVGLAIRALWHRGRRICDVEKASAMIAHLKGSDLRILRLSASIMPAWMRDCLASFARMDCLKRDLQPIGPV